MIKVENLTVKLENSSDGFYILRDVNIQLKKGEILGLAGESGSGKSVLAKTILGINDKYINKINGKISVDGKLIETTEDYKSIRGKVVSMIFQNPMSSLNPVLSIGEQLVETILLHNKMSKAEAINYATELLKDVEIDKPADRLKSYPHQLSGGMNQRVMIALALACNPKILIADEPTTALDVTTQGGVVKLLQKLNATRGLSILFISHDLSLLEKITKQIVIIYSGEVMEVANTLSLDRLHHPYSRSLMKCIPKINFKGELLTIKGNISKNNFSMDNCCIFVDRCDYADKRCRDEKPKFINNITCHKPIGE